jgi:hypothetical protein
MISEIIMTSSKQAEANQKNAQLSTGPVTSKGKQKVSSNRITHGILSTKLLLEHEDPLEFQTLLDDLHRQLSPVGALEQSLVEKITVILWRNRRLVRAETATIEIGTNLKHIVSEVENGLGLLGYGDSSFTKDDMDPPDDSVINFCRKVLAESASIHEWTLDSLRKNTPVIYKQIAWEAKEDRETIDEYIKEEALPDYVTKLASWCRTELKKLEKKKEQYPRAMELADFARDKLAIPWAKLELLSKYQVTLDNQLYKAMKALREAQEWRISSLEALVPVDEESCVDAT